MEDLPDDHESCAICMERFTSDVEKPMELRCGHILGETCMKKWCSSSRPSPTCPICRKEIRCASSIEAWEYIAIVMQKRPYTSRAQTLRRVGTFALEDWAAAVEFVSLLFRVVMELLTWTRRKHIPASAILLKSAQFLAVLMGHLYALLSPTMELMRVTVPWGNRGPPVITILDLEYRRRFEEALEDLALMELGDSSESVDILESTISLLYD